MTRDRIKDELITILRGGELALPRAAHVAIAEETSLLNDVLDDSLQLLELIVQMEKRFGFKIDPKHLNLDMFDQFGNVVDFVDSQLGAMSETKTA